MKTLCDDDSISITFLNWNTSTSISYFKYKKKGKEKMKNNPFFNCSIFSNLFERRQQFHTVGICFGWDVKHNFTVWFWNNKKIYKIEKMTETQTLCTARFNYYWLEMCVNENVPLVERMNFIPGCPAGNIVPNFRIFIKFLMTWFKWIVTWSARHLCRIHKLHIEHFSLSFCE